MRILLPTAIVLCICACSASEGTDGANAADEKALRHLKEVEWPRAYREQDTVLLERLLHDDFEMIDAEGSVFTKQDELEWIKANAMHVDSFRYEIKRLDIWPNGVAIVSGMGHKLSDSTETTYWSSNVLLKTDDHWRAISSHVSGVNEIVVSPELPRP